MNSKPDTLTVQTSLVRELSADSASATVVVVGDAVFSGASAFKKAKQVAELIDRLVAIGVSRESVCMQNIELDSDQVVGIKTSSCRYTLVVKAIPVEHLSAALATIADSKQCSLRYLNWNFSKLNDETEALRQESIAAALNQAKSTAEALGVTLEGIYNFTESIESPERKNYQTGGDFNLNIRAKKSRSAPMDLGFSLFHTAELKLSAIAEFRVSAFR